jgi:hypothetical protein
MKNYVLLVITLFAITNMAAKQKTIEFANKAKSYDISVMSGEGKLATARMDASYENPRTKRFVYPSKKLKVQFDEIKGGQKLKGTIALQAYDVESGAKSHDEPRFYTIEINNVQEIPNIKLDYGLFGYSFDADKKLQLKTKKTNQLAPQLKLGS